MKILVVCQYYYPEPFRISDLCEEMVKRGHEVTVLTGVPNYPEGVIYREYRAGQRRNEIINGVKVQRCFTVGRKTGILYRFLNYYSFVLSSTVRVLLNRNKPEDGTEYDVVFVNQLSPVMMAYAGILYKKVHHKKLVMYCLDLWPESLVAGGIKRNTALYRLFHKISKQIYRSCDQILVTSKMFTAYIADEFGIKKNKIAYLPQYAESMFDGIDSDQNEKDTIDFVFAGNIGEIQSVETVIKAAEILKDEVSEEGKKLVFHIVGSGTDLERLRKMVSDKKSNNIIFHGRKPLSEMPIYYSLADAMLVTLGDDDIISMTLPGKIQSYMVAGKPIIGAIKGEAAKVIKDSNCGFVGMAEDSKKLAENVKKFICLSVNQRNQLGANGRSYYEKYFDRKIYMDKLEKVFCVNVKGN